MTRPIWEDFPEVADITVRFWSCPIEWHRYVKWDGDRAYCIEPGCWHSNVEQAGSGR